MLSSLGASSHKAQFCFKAFRNTEILSAVLVYWTVIDTSKRLDESELISLHSVFNDFRVDAGHSVHGVRSHNAEVSHVDFLLAAFFDQGHPAQAVVVSGIKLTDALEELRKRLDIPQDSLFYGNVKERNCGGYTMQGRNGG